MYMSTHIISRTRKNYCTFGINDNIVTYKRLPLSTVLSIFENNNGELKYIASTHSNINGEYMFTLLRSKEYSIAVKMPNGGYFYRNVIPSSISVNEQINLYDNIVNDKLSSRDYDIFTNDCFNIPESEFNNKVYEKGSVVDIFIDGHSKDNLYIVGLYFIDMVVEIECDGEYSFDNTSDENLKYISINGNVQIYDRILHQNVQRGYISASVVIGECGDSDFVIHCFRSSDKQFIGEYPIIDDRYTIDNLNLTQTYDIMLHDKNKVVETQVHSRRTPSIYQ